ncbi:thiolase family protein [Lacisediminihabitans profunda]|uniref:Thiolase family protein n=1 Tax=Lacisediminihabitans profunda TaxID=2594790 RepID=A0A5C8UX97_9MICO|nr:thiolase family protein [Lacisediminihabitans profunda]TXN32302.1 thiolase family protein [Lacisediminihabitans profunda]
MTSDRVPVVVAARRTPIATKGARLAHVTAEHLAAPVIRACVDDARAATGARADIGDVVLGNCMGPGGNIARLAALAAGIDVAVPGMTVDRQCGSGLSAIITAGEAIRAGDDRLQLAGGVESASTAPTRTFAGIAYFRAPFAPSGFPDPEMGPAAQALALRYDIDRHQQDNYAARSHQLAYDAHRLGRFDEEIVAIGDVRVDDGPRAGIPAMLGRFAPLFAPADGELNGTVTAGNSCRISDGAAAVAMVPAGSRGTTPGLALVAAATVGCDPALPGIGPVAAITRALADAGVTLADVAAFEIVEAFAAQTLAVLHLLGLAPDGVADPRVCAQGGALALGHPWGASGAVSVVRLFSRLVRGNAPAGTLGIATAAVGGGMGVAALFKVVR